MRNALVLDWPNLDHNAEIQISEISLAINNLLQLSNVRAPVIFQLENVFKVLVPVSLNAEKVLNLRYLICVIGFPFVHNRMKL